MSHSDLLHTGAAIAAARFVMPRTNSDPAAVADLRRAIEQDVPAADAAARAWTQLGADLPPTEAQVIGRVGWVRANLDGLDGILTPIAAQLKGRRRIASRVFGTQIGALLGMLSGKVIGQFVLPLAKEAPGRLVLVGPNLLDLAEEHGELADDIRRTVLVHEITHRLQFDGVPWLATHLRSLLGDYLADAKVDPKVVMERASALPEVLEEIRETQSIAPMMKIVLSEQQREVLERAQGLMSLLEGHGNATMFSGSEGVVEDPDAVREALGARRPDLAAKVLTAVAGLEMKKRQYRDGEAFVRGVVDQGGVPLLNRAFASAENLPTDREIHDVEAWIARVAA